MSNRKTQHNEEHSDDMEAVARQCGYESAYAQAFDLVAHEYPGATQKMLEAAASKAVSIATRELDSLSRVIAMNRV